MALQPVVTITTVPPYGSYPAFLLKTVTHAGVTTEYTSTDNITWIPEPDNGGFINDIAIKSLSTGNPYRMRGSVRSSESNKNN